MNTPKLRKGVRVRVKDDDQLRDAGKYLTVTSFSYTTWLSNGHPYSDESLHYVGEPLDEINPEAGDTIILRDDLVAGERYGRWIWVDAMEKTIDVTKPHTVRRIYLETGVMIDGITSIISKEMIKCVVKKTETDHNFIYPEIDMNNLKYPEGTPVIGRNKLDHSWRAGYQYGEYRDTNPKHKHFCTKSLDCNQSFKYCQYYTGAITYKEPKNSTLAPNRIIYCGTYMGSHHPYGIEDIKASDCAKSHPVYFLYLHQHTKLTIHPDLLQIALDQLLITKSSKNEVCRASEEINGSERGRAIRVPLKKKPVKIAGYDLGNAVNVGRQKGRIGHYACPSPIRFPENPRQED